MKKLFVIAVGVLALTAACKKKAKSKKAMCESMYDGRQSMPLFKDKDGSKKAIYIKECLTMPEPYLKCDSGGAMTKKCMKLIEKYQDDLNTVLITGKSLKEVRAIKAKRKKEREDAKKKAKAAKKK